MEIRKNYFADERPDDFKEMASRGPRSDTAGHVRGTTPFYADAAVSIESPEGPSELPLEAFFQFGGLATRRGIHCHGSALSARPGPHDFPLPQGQPRQAEWRFGVVDSRRGRTEQGRVATARVALGAIGGMPTRAHSLEQALRGASPAPQEIERAVASAAVGISACSDAIASDWYRKAVLPVHLRRSLSTRYFPILRGRANDQNPFNGLERRRAGGVRRQRNGNTSYFLRDKTRDQRQSWMSPRKLRHMHGAYRWRAAPRLHCTLVEDCRGASIEQSAAPRRRSRASSATPKSP